WVYNIWTDPNDIRNSNSNIRRKWYYNNPASSFRGQEVMKHDRLDTMFHIYPNTTKFEGTNPAGFGQQGTNQDFYRMRLAETYLLRAEAYLGKADKVNAATDINAVRSRAGAAPVAPANVTIDYILDERARELFMEEPRRRTLVRLGKLVERTKLYNSYLAGSPGSAGTLGPGSTIQDKHELLPIPQSTIAANTGAELKQNPGY
ncbi:MAG TPA: RagB/SusD family nutrient uptake outer membrane protein, partial [Chitinophagaceae bacterium]|nr:RagB/SusD family nutrient uptake outer membrane protein [Chitinophagaceae bacterium]